MGTIFHTHAEDALRLCKAGSAEPMGTRKEKTISGILLILVPGELSRKLGIPNPSPKDYQGQHYVYKERLGEEDAFAGLTCYSFNQGKLDVV